MSKVNALHHIAISTGDIKQQIEFFSDVLGMELVALYWMHGVEGAWHGFMRLGDAAVAFVFVKANTTKQTVIGQTHAGNGGGPSAPGTMQHLALNVSTMADLLAMRDRIRSRGVPVFGPLRHGFCTSIYFAGPEGLSLELSTSDGCEHPLDLDGTWIDPEVVGLAGISESELASYMNPAPYADQGGAVPQPAYDPQRPHMVYPSAVYERMLATPDEVMTRKGSVTAPPAK